MAKDLSPQSQPALAGFTWSDPFLLEDQLAEDERMVRDAALAYAQDKLAPRVTDAFATETTDPRSFARWARWASWAPPFPSNMAASARAM